MARNKEEKEEEEEQQQKKTSRTRSRQEEEEEDKKKKTKRGRSLFVGWLLNVPATGECISGTDLHRQFYVLPH